MSEMDKAIRMLKRAQSDLDMAHSEACYALARFDALHDDKTLDGETRLAALSLRAETLEYCGSIRETMNKLPEVAKPKAEIIQQKVELPCVKTAAWMLNKRRDGVVATSARHGRPILTAMCLVIVVSCQLSVVRADTVERVIDALIVIESSGRPAVIGDGGNAVGLLQIHPVAVREANRITGSNRWKLSDRFCPKQSRSMARTILVWHLQRGVTDPVELACRWNKPFGQTTAQYRAKVEATLQQIAKI